MARVLTGSGNVTLSYFELLRAIHLKQTLVVIAVAIISMAIFAFHSWFYRDVTVKGLSFVKPEMTRNEVVTLMGTPHRQRATMMRQGIYGVPDHMEKKIGFGNAFEMLEYEESSPHKSICATVWLTPDPADPNEDTGCNDGGLTEWPKALHIRRDLPILPRFGRLNASVAVTLEF